MKKYTVILGILLFSALAFAQDNTKVDYQKIDDLVKATYYHDNGLVAQEGFFNAEGQLHGVWVSYDTEGHKVTVGTYANGKKVGKWLFWTDNSIREVDYVDSKIAGVNELPLNTEL
jgi:antitoxin component YwqK of YwqJK toxin-antitoxin module